MRWRRGRRSRNIEDRRSRSAGRRMRFPGGLRFPSGSGARRRGVRRGGMGLMGILVVVGLALVFGVDPAVLLQQGSLAPGPSLNQGGAEFSREEQELADFVSVVLADTEDTWGVLFPDQLGARYEEPRLVLFTGSVRSACGTASAAVGPFYCPPDRKVYIDLSFYRDLRERFRAPGDFAQAYVIAHEVGHHIQTLLGISQQVREARSRLSRVDGNKLSVRLELQADCLAGIWAHHADRARQILEQGDIEEALGAASAIGDDRIQRQTQGHVTPDSFTHGTSAQRVRWFKAGFDTGRLEACDTFTAASLER